MSTASSTRPLEEEPSLTTNRLHDVRAVIPVKSLAEAKSRLSSAIPQHKRRQLVLAMLEDILLALHESNALSRVFVASPDRRIAAACRRLGADFILDPVMGLNQALDNATTHICSISDPEALIVFPADVPLLKSNAVAEIVSVLDDDLSPLVVAARSRDGGTNMLMRRPPQVISTSFGPSSFNAHRKLADGAGIRFIEYDSADLEFDIDTEADLLELLERGEGTKTERVAKALLGATGAANCSHASK